MTVLFTQDIDYYPYEHQGDDLATSINAALFEKQRDRPLCEEKDAIDSARSVMAIDTLMKKVTATKSDLFSAKALPAPTNKPLGESLLNYLKLIDFDQIRQHFPKHKLAPLVELYERHTLGKNFGVTLREDPFNSTLGHGYDDEHRRSLIDRLNAFVSDMRREAKSDQFVNRLKNRSRACRQNYVGLVGLIDKLFVDYSKLLVVRLDVAYRTYSASFNLPLRQPSFAQVKGHRKLLMAYLKKKWGDDYLGYAWSLEFGIGGTGYHFHLLLLFNGQRLQQGITIGGIIGRYWNQVITRGLGRFHNCNLNTERYRYVGVGVISHDDVIARGDLLKAASYLTKADYYFRLTGIDNDRSFGKSGYKPKDGPKVGRRRKATESLLRIDPRSVFASALKQPYHAQSDKPFEL